MIQFIVIYRDFCNCVFARLVSVEDFSVFIRFLDDTRGYDLLHHCEYCPESTELDFSSCDLICLSI